MKRSLQFLVSKPILGKFLTEQLTRVAARLLQATMTAARSWTRSLFA